MSAYQSRGATVRSIFALLLTFLLVGCKSEMPLPVPLDDEAAAETEARFKELAFDPPHRIDGKWVNLSNWRTGAEYFRTLKPLESQAAQKHFERVAQLAYLIPLDHETARALSKRPWALMHVKAGVPPILLFSETEGAARQSASRLCPDFERTKSCDWRLVSEGQCLGLAYASNMSTAGATVAGVIEFKGSSQYNWGTGSTKPEAAAAAAKAGCQNCKVFAICPARLDYDQQRASK